MKVEGVVVLLLLLYERVGVGFIIFILSFCIIKRERKKERNVMISAMQYMKNNI